MVDYNSDFFATIRDGCRRSAEAVAPIVHHELKPRTVIDVGCGEGWWAHAFAELGVDVLGIDGHADTDLVPFRRHDLTDPLPSDLDADLVVCLEVAEHLPESHADRLVGDLCRIASRYVLFSAAVPGQGGHGHLNEQWPGYWACLFEARGFVVSGALRFELWQDDRVENWYRQNVLVCAAPGARLPRRWFTGPNVEPVPVVHPVLWESRL